MWILRRHSDTEKLAQQFRIHEDNQRGTAAVDGDRGYNDEGVEEPLKITFVYKTGIHSNFNGKDFKQKRKNAAAVHNDAALCSYTSAEDKKLCLHSSSDTCGVCRVNVTD